MDSEYERYRESPPKFSKKELLRHALNDALISNHELIACHEKDDPFLLWLKPLVKQMENLLSRMYPENKL